MAAFEKAAIALLKTKKERRSPSAAKGSLSSLAERTCLHKKK